MHTAQVRVDTGRAGRVGVPGDSGRFCDGSADGYESATDAARAEPDGVVWEGWREWPAAIGRLARFDLEIVNLHGWSGGAWRGARQLFGSSMERSECLFSRRVRRKRWAGART